MALDPSVARIARMSDSQIEAEISQRIERQTAYVENGDKSMLARYNTDMLVELATELSNRLK